MSIGIGSGLSFPLQSSREAVNDIFKNFDKDKSGELNLKEALKSGAPNEVTFRKADADGNGGVSKGELVSFFDSLDSLNGEVGSGELNSKDLASVLQNGNKDDIKSLLQALLNKDEKSATSIFEKLINENKNKDVEKGSFLDTYV